MVSQAQGTHQAGFIFPTGGNNVIANAFFQIFGTDIVVHDLDGLGADDIVEVITMHHPAARMIFSGEIVQIRSERA